MNQSTVVVTPTKSMGLSIILTVIFGPLGMFYSTIGGAIVMLILTGIVGFFTVGFGLLITWPVCIIWGAMAVKGYNEKLRHGQAMN